MFRQSLWLASSEDCSGNRAWTEFLLQSSEDVSHRDWRNIRKKYLHNTAKEPTTTFKWIVCIFSINQPICKGKDTFFCTEGFCTNYRDHNGRKRAVCLTLIQLFMSLKYLHSCHSPQEGPEKKRGILQGLEIPQPDVFLG